MLLPGVNKGDLHYSVVLKIWLNVAGKKPRVKLHPMEAKLGVLVQHCHQNMNVMQVSSAIKSPSPF